MKKLILLAAFLSFLFSAGARAQADSLVMWTNNEVQFHSMPAIHPNGNVLIRSHYDILEINGLTGEIMRNINVPFTGIVSDWIDISKDGTRFVACRKIVNFETGEIIGELPEETAIVKFLHPDNSKIIYAPFNQAEYNFFVWDIETGESEGFDIGKKLITALEVSNNGKFFAIATLETGYDEEEHTHFYLFDAQTMQFIKELEDYPANGRTIEYIQFSENAKYVCYGQNRLGSIKGSFFLTEAPYSKWMLITETTPPKGFWGLGLIDDNYVFATSDNGLDFYSIIWDIDNEKEIYFSSEYGSSNPLYNYAAKNIIVHDNGNRTIVALDFEKILSTVGVKDELDTNAFRAEYSGGILTINGLESQSVEINLTINNIQGEVVFSQNIAAVHGSQISLPVSLPSGVYIARIRTGENNYSSKFLVVN